MTNKKQRFGFLRSQDIRFKLFLNLLACIWYFLVITLFVDRGNLLLYGLLIIGEIFHTWQCFTFLMTIWNTRHQAYFNTEYLPSVDVFITVAGEPVEVLERTLKAALDMDYPDFKVYILNDAYARGVANWQDVAQLAADYGVTNIMRKHNGGAKAGNINNALRQTKGEFVLILDTDHVPKAEFLREVMGFFVDERLGFVQTPQYYTNKDQNFITQVAWEQQSVFFGPIMQGKNNSASAFMCGTNMVLRRQAIESAGGMCEDNIAEDFVTSLLIHERGWKSLYYPRVLAEGMAPEDFLSYYKQQLRWARGSLEVMFKYNPLFRKGMKFLQKIQYLASASFYLSGVVVLIDILLPLVFYFTNVTPITTATMRVAMIFLPYMVISMIILILSTNYAYSFKALTFAISSFPIHLQALLAVLFKKETRFQVTSKTMIDGSHWRLASWHMLYILITIIGVAYNFVLYGWTASLIANLTWGLFNITMFLPFIYAAINPRPNRILKNLHFPFWLRELLLGQSYRAELNYEREVTRMNAK